MILGDETRVVVNLLKQFGVLTLEQIRILFEGSTFLPMPMISFLCNARIIQFLEDSYAVLQNNPSFQVETIYCVWVMLDKISQSPKAFSKEVKSANACDNGIEVCFINEKQTIEYITFVDSNSISKVSLLQDTFYNRTGVSVGNEENAHRLYTFVVNEETVMESLSKMQLTIPYMVAFVEGEVTGVPKIEYYSL